MYANSILNQSIDLQKSLGHIYPLNAIWLTKRIKTANETTFRIRKGHELRIEGKEVLNVTPDHPATHIVLGCKGTIGDSVLFLELENLITKKLLTLNVK